MCITTSKPGVFTTSSKASTLEISPTATTCSLSPLSLYASRIGLAFSSDRVVVTTEWPFSRSWSKMWAAGSVVSIHHAK